MFCVPSARAAQDKTATPPASQQSHTKAAPKRRSPRPPYHSRRKHRPAARQPRTAAAKPQLPAPPPWPVNQNPGPAKITWDAHGLEIVANNSSLDQILHEVATDIGATITGLSRDQRVFGTYGPGPARDVLSRLLNGSGYNVLMVGDRGNGAPRRIELTTSSAASSSPQMAVSPGSGQPSADGAAQDGDAGQQAPLPARFYPPGYGGLRQPLPFENGGPPPLPQQTLQKMREQQMPPQNNPH